MPRHWISTEQLQELANLCMSDTPTRSQIALASRTIWQVDANQRLDDPQTDPPTPPLDPPP